MDRPVYTVSINDQSHHQIHAPAPPPGIFENQRSSGGPQALPLIQERNGGDSEADEMEEEEEEEAGEARSAVNIQRPPPRNGPPPRSGGKWPSSREEVKVFEGPIHEEYVCLALKMAGKRA